MNKDGKQRVFDALSTIHPKTVRQLMDETGLSNSAVNSALLTLDAHPTGHNPQRWMRESVGSAPACETVVLWRRLRSAVAETTRALTISSSGDPVDLADEFLELGKLLTEIGTAIDKVKMNPDWYEQLGGTL